MRPARALLLPGCAALLLAACSKQAGTPEIDNKALSPSALDDAFAAQEAAAGASSASAATASFGPGASLQAASTAAR